MVRSPLLCAMLAKACHELGLPMHDASFMQPTVLLRVIDAVCIRLDQLEGKTILIEEEGDKR